MQSENNSSSESLYYSPTNTDSPTDIDSPTNTNIQPSIDMDHPSPQNIDINPPKKKIIIDCNCINPEDSCLIFCFNMDTNQFENMDCKIFKSYFK